MTRRTKIKNYLGRNFKRRRRPDKISVKKRSAVMSKIRSKRTDFENVFIKNLKKTFSYEFDTYCVDIKGTPDVVFRKQKICVFLDSNFWHGWQFPRWKHLLKNDFWRSKIEKNRSRDKKTTRYLRRKGWKVMRFWEHGLNKNLDACFKRIKRDLKSNSS